MAAYAYAFTKKAPFVERAVADWSKMFTRAAVTKKIAVPDALTPVDEARGISTNAAAQTGLTTIELLEFCKDHLPDNAIPLPEPRAPR